MPIYEYECRKCGVFDHEQPMSAGPLSRCPSCRSKVTKLISASAFHLKGGGWYADGYDRKKADKEPVAAKSETTDQASTAGGAKGAAGTEKAPAAVGGDGKKKGSKSGSTKSTAAA